MDIQTYLAPSINFHLVTNTFPQSTLGKLEWLATRMLKKWLKLPCNATFAILYHPKVLNCSQPTFQYKKASLSYITETKLQTGSEDLQTNHWNEHLATLLVQCKFSNVVSLEGEQHLWSKLMRMVCLRVNILPGSDTLPTPLNLRRMKIQCGGLCKLCRSPQPTTAHILSSYPEALSQGRYTWRHDSVLQCICSFLNGPILRNAKLYAGLRFDDSPPLTIPSSIQCGLSLSQQKVCGIA